MKVQIVELETFNFQYLNSHWQLNELPVASVRELGGQLTLRKEKVKIHWSQNDSIPSMWAPFYTEYIATQQRRGVLYKHRIIAQSFALFQRYLRDFGFS